jgi:hypothetical protein
MLFSNCNKKINVTKNLLPLATDIHLASFYDEIPTSVSYPKIDSLLSLYDNILIENGIIDQVNSDNMDSIFRIAFENNELTLPSYGRTSRCPFKLSGFKAQLDENLLKIEKISTKSELFKILEGYRKIKEGRSLGPKVTSTFFIESFNPSLWNDEKYRKLGYMFYFLFTTIEDQER